jgi:hypothetical protein
MPKVVRTEARRSTRSPSLCDIATPSHVCSQPALVVAGLCRSYPRCAQMNNDTSGCSTLHCIIDKCRYSSITAMNVYPCVAISHGIHSLWGAYAMHCHHAAAVRRPCLTCATYSPCQRRAYDTQEYSSCRFRRYAHALRSFCSFIALRLRLHRRVLRHPSQHGRFVCATCTKLHGRRSHLAFLMYYLPKRP